MAEPILNSNPPACLLCGSNNIFIRHSLSAENIIACWLQDGRPLPPFSIQNLREEGMIHLYECRKCGFQFFDPKLAGGEEFYDGLHANRSDYYAPDRPENERNTRFAIERGYKSILDVGCGVGFALDTAKRAGLSTYGIEMSRSALATASEKGHTVFPVLLENLAPEWEGKFDLIFAGPPYALSNIDELPVEIFKHGLLNENGWFVLEHTPRNDYQKFPHFRTFRNYGTTLFSIFLNKEKN